MITLWSIVNNRVTTHDVPDRIVVLVKDFIAFRKRTSPMVTDDVVKGSKKVGSFMTVRINWKINEDICRRAVAEYKCKWSKKEGVDIKEY